MSPLIVEHLLDAAGGFETSPRSDWQLTTSRSQPAFPDATFDESSIRRRPKDRLHPPGLGHLDDLAFRGSVNVFGQAGFQVRDLDVHGS